MKKNEISQAIGDVGSVIGRGLIAGIVGTTAITVSQMIDMKLTGRAPSDAPAIVGGKVLGVEPSGSGKRESRELAKTKKANELKFSQFMHWGYGTGWGIFRGLLAGGGLKGWGATAVHFGAIWGTELIMVPGMTKTPPPTKWAPKELLKDALMHMIYAAAAGATFDAINKKR